jgi:hypothetical protein
MSQDSLIQVLERASTDAAFRAQLVSKPDAALAGYSLTADERAALLSGDAGQLRALGVDARVTKSIESPTTPGSDELCLP